METLIELISELRSEVKQLKQENQRLNAELLETLEYIVENESETLEHTDL